MRGALALSAVVLLPTIVHMKLNPPPTTAKREHLMRLSEIAQAKMLAQTQREYDQALQKAKQLARDQADQVVRECLAAADKGKTEHEVFAKFDLPVGAVPRDELRGMLSKELANRLPDTKVQFVRDTWSSRHSEETWKKEHFVVLISWSDGKQSKEG